MSRSWKWTQTDSHHTQRLVRMHCPPRPYYIDKIPDGATAIHVYVKDTMWCPPRWSLYHGTTVSSLLCSGEDGDMFGKDSVGDWTDFGEADGDSHGKNAFLPSAPGKTQGSKLKNDEQAAQAAAFCSFNPSISFLNRRIHFI